MVVTQTCDLERGRGSIQVAPLVTLTPEEDAKWGGKKSPRYFPLDGSIYADFETVMTVDGAEVRAFAPSALDLQSERALREALARRFGRAAVPGHVASALQEFRKYVIEKDGKDSPQGRMINKIKEIRVGMRPDWKEGSIKSLVTVHLILEAGDLFDDGLVDFDADQNADTYAELERSALETAYGPKPKDAIGVLAAQLETTIPGSAEYAILWLALAEAFRLLVEPQLGSQIEELVVEVTDKRAARLELVDSTDVLDLAFLSGDED